MSDIKVQIVIDEKAYALDDEGMAKLFAACRQEKTFGGTEYSDPEYGIVKVKLGKDGKEYTVQVGNWEWELAEKAFGVKGVQGVIKASESEKNATEFYRIALSRHHANMSTKDVAALRDWRRKGEPTLKDAVERALAFSKPHVFPDEEADPKALEAVKAGLLLLMSPPASPSST